MGSEGTIACRYRLASAPASGNAAIAILELRGEVDSALGALRIRSVALGGAVLRDWPGVDTVVVVRVSPDAALCFPHAGAAVLRRALTALSAAGIGAATDAGRGFEYVEAASVIEDRMLAAVSRAASPLAIDLLLDQPRRWARAEGDASARLPDEANRSLNRLIDPPLVVALGAPNIGKSSLVNALAGRGVAIVADAPGTTRDHVGVELDLAGLVVRYVDTPGIGALAAGPAGVRALDREAQAVALRVAAGADLILLCADASAAFLTTDAGPPGGVLRVGLRADLGGPAGGCDVSVSVRNNRGLEELTRAIRGRLVPDALLADQRAWEFW